MIQLARRALLPIAAALLVTILAYAAGETENSRAFPGGETTAKLVTREVLDIELKSRLALLASQLKSADYFDRVKKRILPQHGGVTACLALAYARHPETTDDAQRQALIAISLAAKDLAIAQSYDEATKALARIQSADAGIVDADDNPPAWGTLIGTHQLMEEIERQSSTLGKAFRGNKYNGDESHHLALLTLLTIPLEETDYGFTDDDDRARWQEFSQDLRKHTQASVTALAGGDKKSATSSFLAAQKVCTECHGAFR